MKNRTRALPIDLVPPPVLRLPPAWGRIFVGSWDLGWRAVRRTRRQYVRGKEADRSASFRFVIAQLKAEKKRLGIKP